MPAPHLLRRRQTPHRIELKPLDVGAPRRNRTTAVDDRCWLFGSNLILGAQRKRDRVLAAAAEERA